MISCNLMGGIGNQLFQIATTHALALRNNDISGFDFNKCFTPLQGKPSNNYSDSILKKLNRIENYPFKSVFNEQEHVYSPIPYSKDLLLNGYFQCPKYFDDFSNEIKELIYISEENIEIVKSVMGFPKTER